MLYDQLLKKNYRSLILFHQSTLQISVMTITLYVNKYNGTSNVTLFHRMTMNLIKIQHEYKC
jgi:hypothetical protein